MGRQDIVHNRVLSFDPINTALGNAIELPDFLWNKRFVWTFTIGSKYGQQLQESVGIECQIYR